jgi:hypothetical protein
VYIENGGTGYFVLVESQRRNRNYKSTPSKEDIEQQGDGGC